MLRNSISSLYKSPTMRRLTNSMTSDYATIFMLHRFQSPIAPSHAEHNTGFLETILQEIRKFNIPVVTVDDIIQAKLGYKEVPENALAFTMDDGFLDQAEIGAELFIKYDIPATIFLVTDFLDGDYWPADCQVEYIITNTKKTTQLTLQLEFNEVTLALENKAYTRTQVIDLIRRMPLKKAHEFVSAFAVAAEVDLPSKPAYEYRPMSWQNARQLERRGISFGPHTCKHPLLSQEEDSVAEYEIKSSIERLSSELKSYSKVFCYPTGRKNDFTERDALYAQQGGCIGAVNAQPGYANTKSTKNIFNIDRFALPQTLSEYRQYAYKFERLKQLFLRWQ